MTTDNNTIKKSYNQLSPEERGKLEELHNLHFSCRQIAKALKRAPSTISRELKRGTVRQLKAESKPFVNYFAETGSAIYKENRSRCHSKSLLESCFFFFQKLAEALKQRPRIESIDSFIGYFKIRYPNVKCPSTPTVYRYIDDGKLEIKNIDLPAKLRRKTKSNHKAHTRKNKKILGISIEERPGIVETRSEFGHWEGDLVKGKRTVTEPALLTLTERQSRFEVILKIPNYLASTCLKAVRKAIKETGEQYFKSITFDNGSEFSMLNSLTETNIYFAHPYSPWERGSNENQNGLLREFFPKGKSLHSVSKDYVKQIQDALNQRHRKILGYKNASTCFNNQQLLYHLS